MVNRVAELKPVIIDLTDGYGKNMTRVGLLAPDGTVYWVSENAVLQQAQVWVGQQVLAKLTPVVQAG